MLTSSILAGAIIVATASFLDGTIKNFALVASRKSIKKEKWVNDPEGMREKERVRYREKRKKS
jgi:hypothetical protein